MNKKERKELSEIRENFADLIRKYDKEKHTGMKFDLIKAREILIKIDRKEGTVRTKKS